MPPPRNTTSTTLAPEPLASVVEVLRCPECESGLQVFGRQLGCTRGHRFDIARQGYASLLNGASTASSGDSAAMLDARRAVQDTGLFAPVAEVVATVIGNASGNGPQWVVDVGAGTGYYAARVLDTWKATRGVAVDISKAAGRRCARGHPRLGSVVADIWRGLPVRDHSVDAVLSVFAPRNPAETRRVLTANGRFVLVTPTERHLRELVRARDLVRVDPKKSERLSTRLAGLFTVAEQQLVEYSIAPPRAVLDGLIAMGPSARHGHGIGDLPDNFSVTVSVDVTHCLPL